MDIDSLSLDVIMAVWWNIIIFINGVGWRTNVFPARPDVIPLAYIAIKNTPIILKYTLQIRLASIAIKNTPIIQRSAPKVLHPR